MNQFNRIATDIIRSNRYLTLATTDGVQTWAAPLWFVHDESFNFYFISDQRSIHGKHIALHSQVAAAIYNSQEIPQNVNGVQIDAIASIVPIEKIPKVLKLIFASPDADIFKRRFRDYLNPQTYATLTHFRIYQIVPQNAYILNPKIYKTDKRVRVELK